MNNFKEELKQELRSDAPFTAEMKQRMLMNKRLVKDPAKKFNWKVSVISLTFVLIVGFVVMLQFTSNEATSSKVVAKLPSDPNDLLSLLQKNETTLPIMEENGQLVVQPNISYVMGKQWVLSNIPMLIDPNAEIKVGDYIAYYDMYDIIVAPVYGLAGDKIKTTAGQVMLNDGFLALPGAVAQAEFKDPEQQALFNYYFTDRSQARTTKRRYIDVNLEPLHEDEYVVYTNDNGQTVSVINDAQIAGKVVGIKKFEPSFTLTAEEQSLYKAFKENYDLSLLVGAEPLTIAKMYVFAESERDYETKFALLTSREAPVRTLRVKYIQDTQKIREYYTTKEIQKLLSAYIFNGIEKGQFEQRTEISGEINFISTYGNSKSAAGMLKNEQGIWQPSFTSPFE